MSIISRLKGKVTFINIILNVALQFTTIISGLIIPKLILSYFGSSVNGLVSSLTQFLSYITLIEGGITGVVRANLYKPLVCKDYEKISAILSTAKRFYRKIGIIFSIYPLVLASVYPLIFDTEFTWVYIFTLTIILSLNLLIQYMFSLTLKTFLIADKKIYIVSSVQIIFTLFNLALSYISVKVFPSIHILKAISGILFLLQPLVFSYFINRNHIIQWNVKPDNGLLRERWNGFAINLAAFIHQSTDVSVLTIFTNLHTVSVYSVYCLVTGGLNRLVQSITSAITPSLGHAYARGDEIEINQKLDLYEYIVFNIVGILFTLTAILITPFVMLYTSGVNDANYYEPTFGILITISEALYLIKFPHLTLSYAANKFKELTIPAFWEALINIIVSIVLVNYFGLIGVAIGTICGMTFRLCYQVFFTTKIVPSRRPSIFFIKFIIFAFTSLLGVLICKIFFPLHNVSIAEWIKHGFLYAIILILLYSVDSFLFFKKDVLYLVKYLAKRR